MIDSFGRKVYAQRTKETTSNSFPTKIPKQEPDIVNGKELISFSEKMKKDAFEMIKPDAPF